MALGQFLTADEFLWVDRARNFLAGLTDPTYQCTTYIPNRAVAHGLECTLRTGHPGVTTMWSGVVGFVARWLWDGGATSLHHYVVATNPLDASFIVWERFGVVLITSLSIAIMYGLVGRLFGTQIALLTALLLALNPFHIALSRVIHHDALSTSFMTLSVLAAFIYWGESPHRKIWLVLSGVCAGLAFLSKLPSLFLGPMMALIGLWFTHPKANFQNLKSLLRDGLLWLAVAVAVFVMLWPSMWVIPKETVEVVFFMGSKYSMEGQAKGNFFWGNISNDPGLFFYPVTWLYRTSPLVMAGLAIMAIAWLKRVKQGRIGQRFGHVTPSYLLLILLFILGYGLMMTVVAKKQERYLLPIYPWLDLLAAVGLDKLKWHNEKIKIFNFSFLIPKFAMLILFVNGYFVVTNYPYYFTYYNPLAGGITSAEQAITLGWGEGMDLAAADLNDTAPPYPRVASWYQSTFAPYYRGEAISYAKEKGKVLAGERVIFYLNQKQRRFPDDAFFAYFERRSPPLKVISLHGVDYVWIYPSLGLNHYVEDQSYTGMAALLAWQWGQGATDHYQGMPTLTSGQAIEVDLFWEYLGKSPQEPFFLRIIDGQKRIVAEGQSQLSPTANPPFEQWRDGEILQEQARLTIPPGTPPGYYGLHIGFYTQAPAVKEGELLFTLPAEESLVLITATTALTNPLTLKKSLGQSLTLLNATLPLTASQHLATELYWQIDRPLTADFAVHVGLVDKQGQVKQAWFNLTLAETISPTLTTWQTGTLIKTQWQLDILPTVPAGVYHLEVILPSDANEKVELGNFIKTNR